jgi:LDH2 family malate/lactate/ureidoglycolate dehydrogenase
MGHIAAYRSMEKAIAKAEEYGIGWVSVRDSGHFGVAGLFPMMALQKDFIGYVISNSAPMMFPWGGRERIIGNNPLAYAIPADRCPPIVLDFSLSVVSSGKLILTRKKGEKIPLGWAVDKNGLPTDNPYKGYEGGGSLAPVGGHKGMEWCWSMMLTVSRWQIDPADQDTRRKGERHPWYLPFLHGSGPDCLSDGKFQKSIDAYIQTT